MTILHLLGKKLFGMRKTMWLFLCGVLVVAGQAGAQNTERKDKEPAGNDRPPVTRPVVKYGPPSWQNIDDLPNSVGPVTKYGPPPAPVYGPPTRPLPSDLDGTQSPKPTPKR